MPSASAGDRSQTNVVCKLCKTVIPTKTGNTTNFFYHLSRSHPLEHSRIRQQLPTTSVAANATPQKQQQTTMERYSASVPYDKASKSYKDITKAVAYHIAKDMLPLSTVEKPGYKNLPHVPDPRYVIPGRKYFSKTAIPKLYLTCKESVQQDLLTDSTSSIICNLCCHCFSAASAGKDSRVDRAVGVCKKVVSTFSYSWKKKSALSKAQQRLHLPPHQLVTESLTRWGSRQKMVARVLEQQKAITEVLSSDKNNRHLIPMWQDIDVLESMNAALTLLLEFTDSLSGESYVTVSYVKPVLHLFRSNLLKVNEGDTELTKEMKTKIMTYLDERNAGPDTDDLLDMATLMDPMFKAQYIRPEKVGAIKMRAAHEVVNEDQGQSQAGDSEGAADQGAEGGVAPATGPPLPLGVKKQRKSLESFFKKWSQEEDALPLTDEQKVQNELERYLMCPDADSESEPLDWWRLHEHNFTRLSQLAKKYLCNPATSTPSERIFSTGGNIVTCTRAALKLEKVKQLVFLAQNLE
ncbi:hypothetical protein F2P81_016268 [Scophthalmus maximus]|uniref:BED-type domain-containing protein n=2 Tax=Scophthalmus maximus TaxID=52904 RepID=A0A6A4SC20_SCOMX|nr:hypothetical protein F2P81_016268 [Scophthalmus maximus]